MNLRAGFWKEGCLPLGHVGLKGSKLSDPSTTRPAGSEATEQFFDFLIPWCSVKARNDESGEKRPCRGRGFR